MALMCQANGPVVCGRGFAHSSLSVNYRYHSHGFFHDTITYILSDSDIPDFILSDYVKSESGIPDSDMSTLIYLTLPQTISINRAYKKGPRSALRTITGLPTKLPGQKKSIDVSHRRYATTLKT